MAKPTTAVETSSPTDHQELGKTRRIEWPGRAEGAETNVDFAAETGCDTKMDPFVSARLG
jgi:hypothetical protein